MPVPKSGMAIVGLPSTKNLKISKFVQVFPQFSAQPPALNVAITSQSTAKVTEIWIGFSVNVLFEKYW
jgi:hypothetical protein